MPQIIITVDTEIGELSKHTPNGFETFIEGKVDGQEVGYGFIMNMLDKYGAKGEFFLDVYPCEKVGEKKFVEMCNRIKESGHRVQLHTHPSTAFDAERPYLHQYSLDEQIEILSFGRKTIEQWTGDLPIAHRAGMYGINRETFIALEHTGILYDCSYFYKHTNCKLTCTTKNKPFRIGNVTEIPVTVFKKIATLKNPIKIASQFLMRKRTRHNYFRKECFQKLDLRQTTTPDEIKKTIDNSNPDTIITLFLHSFNFLDLLFNFRTNEYASIRVNQSLINSFENVLAWIAEQESCKFNTIDRLQIDFAESDQYVSINCKDDSSMKQGLVRLLRSHVLGERAV